MWKAIVVAALVFTPSLAAQELRPALDTAVARVLVDAWKRQPGDSIVCLHGEVTDSTIEFTSAELSWECAGKDVIGIAGFIADSAAFERDEVQRGMAHVLNERLDLQFAGTVYGSEPVTTPWGLMFAPRVWGVIRGKAK